MKYILSFFLSLSAIASYACSCANPGAINEEKYNYYEFVARGFIGKVIEGDMQNQFEFIPSKIYKADSQNEIIKLVTNSSSAACGVSVTEGQEWLIFASRNDGQLHVSLCSRSIVLQAPGMNGMPERAQHDLDFLDKQEGQKLNIGNIEKLYSEELGESRTLNIYLPLGFDKSKTYPVIYLLDGSMDEDFVHVSGLLQFSNFPWLNYMPQAILVGISNVDRKRDFTYPSSDKDYKEKYPTTGGSAAFINFIEKELKPFINSAYPTNGTEMLIGQSLGGLLASEILYKKPELFDHYFIVSPSLWYDYLSLLETEPAFNEKNHPQSVYIAVGDEGRVMKTVAKKLYKTVKKEDAIHSQFEYFKDEDHASILHQALYTGFKTYYERTGLTPEPQP